MIDESSEPSGPQEQVPDAGAVDEEKKELEEVLEKHRKAGKILAKVADDSKRMIIVGEGLLDIAESIEKMIRDNGVEPAFPVNISLNEFAAHYTPEADCKKTLGEKDLVKIDMGVHVDGYIADMAYTVDLSGEQGKLVEAAEEALNAGIAEIKAGVQISKISEAIHAAFEKHGVKPIDNLTGHKLLQYILHPGVSIPNVRGNYEYTLSENEVFAIEPFGTNGAGHVVDTDQEEIFSLSNIGNVRMRETRRILNFIQEKYNLLPFAERWLAAEFKSKLLLRSSLRELMVLGLITPYPVLRDRDKGMVAQAEHTVIVTNDGCEITTKL